MFGLLNTTQIYTIQQQKEEQQKQQEEEEENLQLHIEQKFTKKSTVNFLEKFLKSDLLNGGTSKYDTLKNYKNFHIYQNNTNNNNNNNINNSNSNKSIQVKNRYSDPIQSESLLTADNCCLQGNYRHSFDADLYYNKNITTKSTIITKAVEEKLLNIEMTIKCSRNLLDVESNDIVAAATLQNYQKIPENVNELIHVDGDICNDNNGDCDNHNLIQSSGASSGEFNSSSDATTTSNNGSTTNFSTSTNTSTSTTNLYKRFSLTGGRQLGTQKSEGNTNTNSLKDTMMPTSTSMPVPASRNQLTKNTSASLKCIDLQRRSSSTSSGDYLTKYERNKKGPLLISNIEKANITCPESNVQISPEKMQRRKLIQILSSYEQQNKQLQRELVKERRRRTEELACVVKSLLCFESKLKSDMKTINQRLLQKDMEICRLLSQKQALKKYITNMKNTDEGIPDEGVVEDQPERKGHNQVVLELQNENDCMVMEALQCINCRKQFYDIEATDKGTQTSAGICKIDNIEQNSSSDETVSSSFFGARRSVRYTSKRTSGTFRDYMRSRAMNIDDLSLEAIDFNSEAGDRDNDGINSCISRKESANSYDCKLHIYSRKIERLHGVKSESERDSEQSGFETTTTLSTRSTSRASTKSSKSYSSMSIGKNSELNHSLGEEEDDGIFSPTQDDDFDEDDQQQNQKEANQQPKQQHEQSRENLVKIKYREPFSEASPKQIYETSTDDWYASASDQDETGAAGILSSNCYGQGAVNPVLECVNQILLQQSMEVVEEQKPLSTVALPRRSSLSDRRNGHCNNYSNSNSQNSTLTRKRVHFSTKNSMVHVPRNDDEDNESVENISENHYNNNGNHYNNGSIDEVISNYQTVSTNYIRHSSSFVEDIDDIDDNSNDNSNIGNNIKRIEQSSVKVKKLNEQHHDDPIRNVTERLDLLNYESIYSNEYEPIGSEINSSNLYVDMETTMENGKSNDSNDDGCNNNRVCIKNTKLPPALPPKPANLMKFKKNTLEQLPESPEEPEESEHEITTTTPTITIIEPDYCSISEVNDINGDGGIDGSIGGIDSAITSVQIKADVHHPPIIDGDDIYLESIAAAEIDLESVTIISDNASQKTEEIEEIFADIPKLPNVEAIIAPKSVINNLKQNKHTNEYLLMNPNLNNNNSENNSNKILLEPFTAPASILTTTADRKDLKLNLNPLMINSPLIKDGRNNSIIKSPASIPKSSSLTSTPLKPVSYKCRPGPNIWNEINKRFSLPNSPVTSTAGAIVTELMSPKSPFGKLSNTDLPIQAEFDWYNLDAEYGRSNIDSTTDLLSGNDALNSVLLNSSLSEIQEDGESVITTADEYNLDEEYAHDENDVTDIYNKQQQNNKEQHKTELDEIKTEKYSIQRNFDDTTTSTANTNTILSSTTMDMQSPLPFVNSNIRAKKIEKNLANFEKFIESSGLSAKPLAGACNTSPTAVITAAAATTTKRKIYFPGPFV